MASRFTLKLQYPHPGITCLGDKPDFFSDLIVQLTIIRNVLIYGAWYVCEFLILQIFFLIDVTVSLQ